MQDHEKLKTELLEMNRQVQSLLVRTKTLPGAAPNAFDSWSAICSGIARQDFEKTMRIAVIGAIKSGKSTLVNSLLAGDYVKRGAGVVTAMVTRVRRGERLRALLYFKSWKEVNDEIQQALVLFPSPEWHSRRNDFDIRREQDRRDLGRALGTLETRQLVSNDMRNADSVYLSSYLRGYDAVRDFVADEPVRRVYEDQEFSAHLDFSGNEILAFYLKDIELEINTGDIDKNIEIADCQGSDSPNPHHMAMIQDYLMTAHLLIYVISSRTGIRMADINFLNMIRKMGLIEQILFVVNVDFNEHEYVDDLKKLISKIRDDLHAIRPEPEIYALPALYNLFRQQRDVIPERDRMRLDQWEREAGLSSWLNDESRRFLERFHQVATGGRYAVLLSNHLERLRVIASGIRQWIKMNQGVLTRGTDEISELIKKIKSQQKKTDRVKSMAASTLDGAVQQIRKELRGDVDRFFDPRYGDSVPALLTFVDNYEVPFHEYAEQLSASGFSDTLYLVFQKFKHDIDTFMAAHVNPGIFSFVKASEDKIGSAFEAVIGPYETMIHDALAEYSEVMTELGMGSVTHGRGPASAIDLSELKRSISLELPPASATMNYSAAIRTEAVMRLGASHFWQRVKRLLRRSASSNTANAISALKIAVRRMKAETGQSILFHFKNYRENLKFQYIFKLVDGVAGHIHDSMMERFHDYAEDLEQMTAMTSARQEDRTRLAENMDSIAAELTDIRKRMDRFHETIQPAFKSP
jgi:GTPase SAR1 family protein